MNIPHDHQHGARVPLGGCWGVSRGWDRPRSCRILVGATLGPCESTHKREIPVGAWSSDVGAFLRSQPDIVSRGGKANW